MNIKRTEKHEEARNSLPDSLRPVFDLLAEDYRFAAMQHHGAPYVSYVILADLIRAGWRRTGESEAGEESP
jgi:hypothetical protein